jgi:pimeloyl-ACP methyl ester carboxylesterase
MYEIISAAALALLLLAICVVVIARQRPLAVAAWVRRGSLVRAGFTKMRFPTSIGSLTLFVKGAGPALIFLHGAGDQAGTWAGVAPAFASNYRVILPDLPGHGQSAPKWGPLGVGTVLSGVEAIANADSGKVILVGNSLGAWIACLYAHRYPERVERLVLINGGPIVGARADITLTPKTREEALRTLEAVRDPRSTKVPGYVVDDIVRQAQTGPLKLLTDRAAEMPKYLLDGHLHEIIVPVNLLWGESDQLMSLDYARRMLAQLPVAQLTILSRCGHAPQAECPKELATHLMELLRVPVNPETESMTQGGPVR